MIRQIEENILDHKLLTAKAAQNFLKIKRYRFEAEVKKGVIKFKIVGKTKLYPVWALKEWQKDTVTLTDCSKEATSGTPISLMSVKPESEYSFEKVREQFLKQRQLSTALKGLPKSKRKPVNRLLANSPA